MARNPGSPAPAPAPSSLESSGEHKLTNSEIDKLEHELGIARRKVHVKDEGTVEIGEGAMFDALMDEDPTGKKAREAFEWVPVLIDLGEQADKLMIDGKWYYHGHTAKFRAHQVASVNEQMYNSRRHDAEVQGRASGLRNVQKNWRGGNRGFAPSTTGK